MAILRALFQRISGLFNKSQRDRDLEAELQSHIQLHFDDNLKAGMPPAEARRQALLKLGGIESVKESVRDRGGIPLIETLLQDLRYGLRMLRKNPGFAAAAVLTLALGIGSTTIIFSIIYNGVVNPFPYTSPRRLTTFAVHDMKQAGDGGRVVFSMPEYMDFRAQNHVFEDVIGSMTDHVFFDKGDGSEQLLACYLTTNTMNFLGVPPFLGRAIDDQDGQPTAAPVAVLSHKLWVKDFGSDAKVLGEPIVLDGTSRTIVGVMPPRFQFDGSDVFIPLVLTRSRPAPSAAGSSEPPERRQPFYVWATGRRKPGVTLQQSASDLNVVVHNISKQFPADYPPNFTVIPRSFTDAIVADLKDLLLALIAAVAMVLLLSCSNVANLLLARASAREREIALRSAIGASRGRLLRQLLLESLVLAVAGCAVGCVLAWGGLQWFLTAIPARQKIPVEAVISLNFPCLIFVAIVGLLTTLLCGLAPALHSVRGDLFQKLAGGGRGRQLGFGHGKLRSILVVAEVALALVLLVCAGLMIRSFYALTHVDLGFNPSRVAAAVITYPPNRRLTPDQNRIFLQSVLQHVEALPGVDSVGVSLELPPYGGIQSDIDITGKSHSETWNTQLDSVSEHYFRAVGLRLLSGRLLSSDDVNSARLVAVVNDSFARKFFPNDTPLGHLVKFKAFDQMPETPHNAYFEIVGLVNDVKNDGLDHPSLPELFVPFSIASPPFASLLVRTNVEPQALLANVRQEIAAVDHSVALEEEDTLKNFLYRYSYAQPEFGLMSLGAFASIGLALFFLGVFSVMAYTVSLQTQEIGVRIALGAQRASILRMVLLRGLRLLVAGICLGLVGALFVARLLQSQVWGVSFKDPWTFAAVSVTVIVVGLLACLLPARRAAAVDPMIAIRYE